MHDADFGSQYDNCVLLLSQNANGLITTPYYFILLQIKPFEGHQSLAGFKGFIYFYFLLEWSLSKTNLHDVFVTQQKRAATLHTERKFR